MNPRTLRETYEDVLMALPGVVGVGSECVESEEYLVIYTDVAVEEVEARLPEALKGAPIRLKYLGSVEAQGREED